jgi:Right handed beta helix region
MRVSSSAASRPNGHRRHARRDFMGILDRRLPRRLTDSDGLHLWPFVWTLTVCAAAAVIGLAGPAWLSYPSLNSTKALHISAGPTSPPTRVCRNNAILGGPSSAPPGAIPVPAGDNSDINWGRAHATYWFAPGTHTLGPGEYAQIIPGARSTYIGAPGAVLDGRRVNDTAFGGDISHVTVEYLTIQDFATPGNQGAVNASAAPGWTIRHNTIRDIVPGTAIYAGTDSIIKYNCLTRNGQSAFGTYTIHDTSPVTKGASNVDISSNEISYNDTCNWEKVPNFSGPSPPPGCSGAHEYSGCGCSAGGKFWQTDGGEFDDNFVHGNYSVGVWWDTNNTGFQIEGNDISDNYADGLIYEISYNAIIRNNIFVRNGLGTGATGSGFPASAIYISDSGSDSRVPGKYGTRFRITDNIFADNWGGVVLYENSNRFCNSPVNTSADVCTLVNPAVATLKSCNAVNIAKAPYYSECRWRTQNVLVYRNMFYFHPGSLGSSCTMANDCAFQGLFSEYGTYPPWSPYKAVAVGNRVTFNQNNHFQSNIYKGTWRFMVHEQGNVMSWGMWQDSPYGQDVDSTMNPGGS